MIQALSKWFELLKSRNGNALLMSAASFVSVTFGAYFFMLLGTMHATDKDRQAHLYNATIMAHSIDNYIQLTLQQEAFPKNMLLHNTNYQYTESSLSTVIEIDNGTIFTLEHLQHEGFVTPAKDPTAIRLLNQDHFYDALATTVKIQFDVNELNEVTNIYYLVNLAGSIYTDNRPFDTTEPFFYLVSYTDSVGVGTYGSFDLSNNQMTLLSGNQSPIPSLLHVSPESPMPRHVIQLPGDET